MLNKKQSKKANIIKYAFVLPVLVVFVMQFQTKVVAQIKENTTFEPVKEVQKLTVEAKELTPAEATIVSFEEVKKYIQKEQQSLISQDTIVWVTDFEKEYTKLFIANATEETAPLVIINGKEQENTFYPKDLKIEILGKGSYKKYSPKQAVEKFGQKAKNGAYTIEAEKFTIVPLYAEKKPQKTSSEDLKKYLDLHKTPLYILKGKEITKEKANNILEFGRGIKITRYEEKEAVEKFGEKGKNGVIVIEGPVVNLKDNKNQPKENEERLKQREAQLRERERQVRERSGLSGEELKERAQNIRQRAEKRQQVSAEIRKERRESERQGQINSRLPDQNEERIKERQQTLEERKSELEVRKKEMEEKRNELKDLYRKAAFSVVINKNTTDREIKESIAQFKSNQNIEMKVSNIKRNKNGEIYRIKISLVESSETSNNKKESKAESTFERNSNDAIPEIFIGKPNGVLVISSDYQKIINTIKNNSKN